MQATIYKQFSAQVLKKNTTRLDNIIAKAKLCYANYYLFELEGFSIQWKGAKFWAHRKLLEASLLSKLYLHDYGFKRSMEDWKRAESVSDIYYMPFYHKLIIKQY